MVGLSGLLSLLEVLSEVWLGDIGVSVNTASYVREVVARSGGMLLVATPIFLIHWRYIQRLNTEPTEATSGIRKFFLYLISAITLGWGAALTGELLEGVTGLLLGIPIAESDIWPGRWLFLLLGILSMAHCSSTSSDNFMLMVIGVRRKVGREHGGGCTWQWWG